MCILIHGVEERVAHGSAGGNAGLGVVVEGGLKECDAVVVKGGGHGAQSQAGPLRKGRVPVLQRCAVGPHFLRGRAEQPENFVDLINLTVAREEWALRDHLDQDRTDGPCVHRGRVGGRSEQNFRRAVPQSHDLVSERSDRWAESAGKAKVRQLSERKTSWERPVWGGKR